MKRQIALFLCCLVICMMIVDNASAACSCGERYGPKGEYLGFYNCGCLDGKKCTCDHAEQVRPSRTEKPTIITPSPRPATPSPQPEEKVTIHATFVDPAGTIISEATWTARPIRKSRSDGTSFLACYISHAELEKKLPDGYEMSSAHPDPLEIIIPDGETAVDVVIVVRKAAQNNAFAYISPRVTALSQGNDSLTLDFLFDNLGNLIGVSNGDDWESNLPVGFALNEEHIPVRDADHQSAVLNAMKYSVTQDGQYTVVEFPSAAGGRLILPYGTCEIQENAFRDNQKLLSIAIVNTVKIIGINAFAGCTRLRTIMLPSNVLIGDNAFDRISFSAVFYVPEGSESERWCRENGKTYITYHTPENASGTGGM